MRGRGEGGEWVEEILALVQTLFIIYQRQIKTHMECTGVGERPTQATCPTNVVLVCFFYALMLNVWGNEGGVNGSAQHNGGNRAMVAVVFVCSGGEDRRV